MNEIKFFVCILRRLEWDAINIIYFLDFRMDDEHQHPEIPDDEEEPANMIINEIDGLPNVHPNYQQLQLDLDDENDTTDRNVRSLDELIHDEDLPTSVIVTNVDPHVFKCDIVKVYLFIYKRKFNVSRFSTNKCFVFEFYQADIEHLFHQFGKDATFQYFKSFRRMRVNYHSPSAAAHARIQLHQTRFGETDINCYFAQPVTPKGLFPKFI